MTNFYSKQKPTGSGALLSKTEVARFLGRSIDFVEANVFPVLPNVFVGKRIYIARVELDRWLSGN